MEMTGRVAIVTGGASGVGAAIAHELVRRGAQVVVADRDGAEAHRLARELAAPNGDRAVDVRAPTSRDVQRSRPW
jgi:NAD(P)-dependent dehydrogenase (short-subunit alcohol dehydrogenase family)